jgi:hypothetical protein
MHPYHIKVCYITLSSCLKDRSHAYFMFFTRVCMLVAPEAQLTHLHLKNSSTIFINAWMCCPYSIISHHSLFSVLSDTHAFFSRFRVTSTFSPTTDLCNEKSHCRVATRSTGKVLRTEHTKCMQTMTHTMYRPCDSISFSFLNVRYATY